MSESYEDGYAVGWDEGRLVGFDEGYVAATQDYEPRLAKFWAELQTLNARLDYFNKVLDEKENRS